jgi:hypothetical protein
MNERLAKLGMGFLALTAIAIPASFVASANAQNPPAVGPQGGGFGGQGFQGRPPGGLPMMGMGGGGSAIAADGSSVFILQGNRVIKLDKNSLNVIREVQLPMPQMQPGIGGQGGNRGGGGGQGGGGGGTSK